MSKFRLMPPSQTTKKNKYPVESCRNYMREISNAGFGELENDSETTKRSLIFRKRSFIKLGDSQQQTMKKINLDANLYDSFFYNTNSSSSNDSLPIVLSSPTPGSSDDSQE